MAATTLTSCTGHQVQVFWQSTGHGHIDTVTAGKVAANVNAWAARNAALAAYLQAVSSHHDSPPLPAIRACESGGNYAAVNPTGSFRGAYQFDQGTWNSVASRHHPQLVGLDPARASVRDQDDQAWELYLERGTQPWPVCGR